MKRLTAFLLVLLTLLCYIPSLGEEAAETPPPFEPVEYGDSGPLVTYVQTRLTELGYYSGKISGNYLEGTRAGLRRLQKDYGLEVTGTLTEESYATLQSAEYRILENGIDGEAVKRLQDRLIELGYLNTNATGKFRSATEGAVKAFQRQHGMEATGIADIETQKQLFADSAMPKGTSPTPTPDPMNDLGDINDVVIAGDGESTEDTRDDVPFAQRMVRGTEGENVKKVQTRLTELGFFDGPISGYYMNQTIAAVKKFQEYNGLRIEGTMNEETWDMLFNTGDVVDIHGTPRPSPEPTLPPYYVVVDVTNQVTFVYGLDENNEYTKEVRRMICSTGVVGCDSTPGDWITDGRRARWAYFSLYGSHAQYWTKINENIAFHSVIYRTVDNHALNTKSYYRLGRRASHGCIRLLVSDAKWIYENVRGGSTIHITEDLPYDQELNKSLLPPDLDRSYMLPKATPQPTPEPDYAFDKVPPYEFRTLKKEKKGEDVYWLQCKLRDLGYYKGTITGQYWQGTTDAVKAFQKDHGINANGIANTKTQQAIFADVLYTPTPMPTDPPAPEATPVPAE